MRVVRCKKYRNLGPVYLLENEIDMLKCGHVFCLDCIFSEGMNFKNCIICHFPNVNHGKIHEKMEEKKKSRAISIYSGSSNFERQIQDMITELEKTPPKNESKVSSY